jgi:ketosteroid isomerase-like protein
MADGEKLVREVWARWNSGDREIDDETFDPEIAIHSALTGEVYRGSEGVRRWVAEIDEQFEEWELTVDEVVPRSANELLARGTIHMRGRTSGVVLDQPASWLVEVKDGRIAGIRNFLGRNAAEAET